VEDLVSASPFTALGSLVESTYRGKTILVTGHNGFVGSWLSHWLVRAGATVVGLSLPTVPGGLADVTDLDRLVDAREVDLRDLAAVRNVVEGTAPDMVFHLAAQALVLPSYEDPLATFATNVAGTGNLLEAIRYQPSVRACVVITSDKCYADGDRPHVEEDPLGGNDPYSASKAAAEIVTHSYRVSYFAADGVGVATARAGNIVGGGDWGAHRIVPDCMNAAAALRPLELRHPGAVRPWQHVLDAVAGYLRLGAALIDDPAGAGRAWNFGPDARASATVGDLVGSLLAAWTGLDGTEPPPPTQPGATTPHERAHLTLDSARSHKALGWTPLLSLSDTVEWTVEWYWSFLRDPGADPRTRTIAQIDRYQHLEGESSTSDPAPGIISIDQPEISDMMR
jgi:CDP-glucose 4,6-dehydratase